MSDSLVIIPTYNEKENIGQLLRDIFALSVPFHVLVVDDNSPDGTADIVRSLLSEFAGCLFLEQRKEKSGLGTAYLYGFRWALQRSYKFIFEMDADFSHYPSDLLRLRECCMQGADVAIGSRYIKGGKIENWPLTRILLSKYASWYVRLILGMPVHDTTAGFKCYRRKVLETIDLDRIRFVGYAFQIEMKYKAYCYGFRLQEIPITFRDRQYGASKMSMAIFKEAFLGVLQMRWRKINNSL